MTIIIRNADGQPIYEQIYGQVKQEILSGALQGGDLLPSIRNLAKDLKISVITTKRAYDELEKNGYIHTVAGKGCYVAEKNQEMIQEECFKQIEVHLKEISRLARISNIPREEILEVFGLIEGEE